jgi:hypothetical protein
LEPQGFSGVPDLCVARRQGRIRNLVKPPSALSQLANRLCAAVALLILYGSLLSIEFEWPERDHVLWVLTDRQLWTNRADVVGNIALFVPWGAAAALGARACGRRALPRSSSSGMALPALAQALHLFEAHRDPRIQDIAWNTAGTHVDLGLLILAALVAWLPLWPVVEAAAVRVQWQSLRWRGWWQLLAGEMMAGLAIVASHAAGRIWPRHPHRAAALVGLLLGGQLLVPGSRLRLPGMAGIAFSFTLWAILRQARCETWLALALAVTGTQTLGALAPFDFLSAVRPLHRLPFEAMLRGLMLGNVQALARNACLWGVVLLFAARAGLPARWALPVVAGWVLLLEVLPSVAHGGSDTGDGRAGRGLAGGQSRPLARSAARALVALSPGIGGVPGGLALDTAGYRPTDCRAPTWTGGRPRRCVCLGCTYSASTTNPMPA